MTTTLDRAPLDTPLVLLSTDVGPDLTRRLSALGLRRGAHLRLVRRLAAGGRIVSVGGGRIAIERSVLAAIVAEPAA